MHTLLTIVAAAFATYITRILPYWLFRKKKPGATFLYLEKNIPAAIMVVLIFYSLKDVQWAHTYGIAELLSIALALTLYLKSKSVLLAIVLSTLLYMMLT